MQADKYTSTISTLQGEYGEIKAHTRQGRRRPVYYNIHLNSLHV